MHSSAYIKGFFFFVSLAWMVSCQQSHWWTPPRESNLCDPSKQAAIHNSSLWKTTLGGQDQKAYGCLRITWGTSATEGKSLWVQISASGRITPASSTATGLSLELPKGAQQKPRTFRLFLFGSEYQTRTTLQTALCQKEMNHPQYSCSTRSVGECWFAIAFKPQADSNSTLINIPEAPTRSCHVIVHPALQQKAENKAEPSSEPIEPKAEPVVEVAHEPKAEPLDANEPTQPERSLEPQPEPRPEPQPDISGPCTPPCVQTLAGTGKKGRNDGAGNQASFFKPQGIAIDSQGNLFVADTNNHVIRKVTPAGIVTTYAGNGQPGYKDGSLLQAQFNFPTSVVIDSVDNMYIADTENHVIRMIDVNKQVSTFAGTANTAGTKDGLRTTASFRNPQGLAIHTSGDLYISDTGNHRIRKVQSSTSTVTTLAGKTFGFQDGTGTDALFDQPRGLFIHSKSNMLYIADYENHRIRALNVVSQVVRTVGGDGVKSFKDGPALSASLHYPTSLIMNAQGILVITDSTNARIRLLDLTQKQLSTLAGTHSLGYKDGPALQAQFDLPQGITINKKGILYIVDTDNQRIRTVYP